MSENLSNLCNISGVLGAAIFNEAGHCVDHQLQPPYEPVLVGQALKELMAAFEVCNYLDPSPLETAVAQMSDGYLAIRKVDGFAVIVLASSNLNPAMLNVAFNVLALKLKQGSAQTAISAGSLSISNSNLSIDQSMAGRPVNAVGARVMRGVVQALAKQVGPFAKVMVKKELKKMGASSSTLDQSMFEDFVQNVSKKIDDPDGRRAFLAQARELEE